ncbi:S16 family serine protease [Pseudoneobacillus rhizosphaerae]|uniref:Lon protease n=1 Tax=Pseudoneobacillus rhizosphaerae TaxID=2880968 RepID=A0A9C7LBH6_9BACI|nr:S16 family serine protease [Pseudoneobacillus rhizosphaerae]CAG9609162.1 Lon protease [Pseudoneobacillus rhizosphaerae]
MNKSNIVAGILSILFYFVFLLLYLQDAINEWVFLSVLFFGLLALLLSLIVFRKKRASQREISTALILLMLLFSYEFLLLGYTTPSHLINLYVEPTEAIEDSGIFLLPVQVITIRNKHDLEEILTSRNDDVLTMTKLNNRKIYGYKNRQILSWFQKALIEESENNVKKYLGQEDEWLNQFFKREQISGDSAGLNLVLNGLYKQGQFKNEIPIAVTGAINEKGDVFPVDYMKEKVQITERASIPFMIIPSGNAEEVAEIQNKLKANVEIFAVSNVDEAIQIINDLNK